MESVFQTIKRGVEKSRRVKPEMCAVGMQTETEVENGDAASTSATTATASTSTTVNAQCANCDNQLNEIQAQIALLLNLILEKQCVTPQNALQSMAELIKSEQARGKEPANGKKK